MKILRAARGLLALFAALFFSLLSAGSLEAKAGDEVMLRIRERKSGVLVAQAPARVGDELFFGWIHSWEKIPWNEYFHISDDLTLILDKITFPAFGAGIPENKGRVCYVKDGLIHMEEIGQVFPELVWLNSPTATRELRIAGKFFTQGSDLPDHIQLILTAERGETDVSER